MSEGQVGTVEQHHVEGGEDPRGLQILLTVGGEGQGSQQLDAVQLEKKVRAGQNLRKLREQLCPPDCLNMEYLVMMVSPYPAELRQPGDGPR